MKSWRVIVMCLLLTALNIEISSATAQTDLSIELEMVLGKGPALSSAWSPNGEIIAVGSRNGIRLYTPTLDEIESIDAEMVTGVLWHPDSRILVSEDSSGITLWDTTTRAKLATLEGYTFPAAWHPDGNMLALTTPENSIVLWDMQNNHEQIVMTERDLQSIQSLAWSTSGNQLFSLDADPPANFERSDVFFRTWDSMTGTLLSSSSLDIYFDYSRNVTIKPVNESLVFISSGGQFQLFDLRSKTAVSILEDVPHAGRNLAFSPDNETFALVTHHAHGDNTIQVWDTQMLEIIYTAEVDIAGDIYLDRLNWSPDGSRWLVSGVSSVSILDVATAHVLHSRTDYMLQVNDLDWSPDGTQLAVAYGRELEPAGDFRVRIWNAQQSNVYATCEGHLGPVVAVDWSPDGTRLVSASGSSFFGDRTVRTWNAATCEQENEASTRSDGAYDAQWSSDGSRIAGMAHGAILIWDSDLAAASQVVWSGRAGIAWHPQQDLFATDTFRNLILIESPGVVDLSTEYPVPYSIVEVPQVEAELQTQLERVNALAWNSEGTRLAAGGGAFDWELEAELHNNYSIEIWDTTTSTLEYILTGHEDGVTSLAWDPAGHYLASAGADRTVRVWDTTTGRQLAVLEGHTDIVSVVAWSPDGTYLASGSHDGTVRIWRLAG